MQLRSAVASRGGPAAAVKAIRPCWAQQAGWGVWCMKGTRSLQWGTYRRRKNLGTRNEDEDFRAPMNIGISECSKLVPWNIEWRFRPLCWFSDICQGTCRDPRQHTSTTNRSIQAYKPMRVMHTEKWRWGGHHHECTSCHLEKYKQWW